MSQRLSWCFLSVALLSMVATGCQPEGTSQATCSQQTCPSGCCQNGICQQVPTASACGVGGGICMQCALGQTCVNGTCQQDQPPNQCANCQGCCLNGQCMSGTSPSACGSPGGSCSVCSSSQQCVNGSCQDINMNQCNPTNCSGCCLGSQCITVPTEQQCGQGGYLCAPCGSNQKCDRGQCVEKTTECSASNCPGCCWNNQCFPGNVPQSCGQGGAVCNQCKPGESCEVGACKGQQTTKCDWMTCPLGCCGMDGCHMPPNDQYCGLGGLPCRQCSAFEECSWGTTCQQKTGGGNVICGGVTCQAGYCCDLSYNQCRPSQQCTYNCNCGTGNTQCANCTGYNQCCFNGQCTNAVQGGQRCGRSGSACLDCSNLGGCNANTGQCNNSGGGGGTYRICLQSVTIVCSTGQTGCESGGSEIKVALSAGGQTKESSETPGDETGPYAAQWTPEQCLLFKVPASAMGNITATISECDTVLGVGSCDTVGTCSFGVASPPPAIDLRADCPSSQEISHILFSVRPD